IIQLILPVRVLLTTLHLLLQLTTLNLAGFLVRLPLLLQRPPTTSILRFQAFRDHLLQIQLRLMGEQEMPLPVYYPGTERFSAITIRLELREPAIFVLRT